MGSDLVRQSKPMTKARATLQTLKLTNLALAGLAFLGSLFGVLYIIVALTGSGEDGAAVFALYGLIITIVFLALSVAHVYTAFMVTAGRARGLQTVLAMLHFATFPLGTMYSLYAMWICWIDPDTTKIFDTPAGRRVS